METDKDKKEEERGLSGPPALFRGKVRKTVSVTLTPEHHAKVEEGMLRTGLTRADFIGLLVELFADRAMVPARLLPRE